jgi:CheY-like chemotaxis protein
MQNREDFVVQPKRTILVVDDEPFLVEYVRQVAQRCGYEVLTAFDGDEGWAVFLEYHSKIDVVLTDVVMPSSLDGFGLAKNIRRAAPEMLILFMTGAGLERDPETNIQPYRVLRKPFNPTQLAEMLTENGCSMAPF